MISFIASTLWAEEASDKYCLDYKGSANTWGSSVTDQQSCQQQCEMDSECVGIGYSHDSVYTGAIHWCYICPSDTKLLFAADFGFYRRPGSSSSRKFRDY